MTGERYPWVLRVRSQRGRSETVVDPSPCRRCGYDPVGARKRCPACLALVEEGDTNAV